MFQGPELRSRPDCFTGLVKTYLDSWFITSGLIGGEDSLAGSDDPVSNIAELLLLLRSEEGVCVRHPDSARQTEKSVSAAALQSVCLAQRGCEEESNARHSQHAQ